MATNDIFSAEMTNDAPIDLSFNDLVGEGQKYKDPDALAKAYANLESHARKLEAENAEARAVRDRLEASNNQNRQNEGQAPAGQGDNPSPPPQNEAPPQGNQVDLRSQIREEVRALNEGERAVQNMEAAAAKMVEVYGDPNKANEAIKAKANELGVSVEWLRDSASRSPQAFYATMGLSGAGGGNRQTPSSGDGIRLGSGNEVRNFEFYDKIRRDNPKAYFSAATQTEMMRQARSLGGDFYKR